MTGTKRKPNILGLIPARGGSKGVPGKNLRRVGGRSLIEWAVRAGQGSRYIDRLILSSDDPALMDEAHRVGCEVPFQRPAALAADGTPGIDPVLHALETLPERYDYVVLLQPTSPLRQAEDIDRSVARCLEQGAPAAVTLCPVAQQPHWMYHLDAEGGMQPLMPPETHTARRQELPPLYVLNGAVYVAEVALLKKTRSFLTPETRGVIMPPERSLDIDTEMDLTLCEALLRAVSETP